MFGSLGFPELMLIMFVALIVFGPRRLPEIGRTLGKALGEFKKATDELKSTIEREVRVEELKQIMPSMVTPVQSVSRFEPVRTEAAMLPLDTTTENQVPAQPTLSAIQQSPQPAMETTPAAPGSEVGDVTIAYRSEAPQTGEAVIGTVVETGPVRSE
jgi:TatA/E family protein of Tat protein translocase